MDNTTNISHQKLEVDFAIAYIVHLALYIDWNYYFYFYLLLQETYSINPYPTAFPYGNGMLLHFYQQQESSMTKTVHKVINKKLKTYV